VQRSDAAAGKAIPKAIRWTRIAAGLVLVVVLLLLGRTAGGYLPRFAQWVESLGALGPIVFIVGYVLATIAFAPGSILTLAAGAIFGLVEGVIYVFIAGSLGASAAFLIARYVAREPIERRLRNNPRFRVIDRAIGRQGRKLVFLMRLSPAFPFNLLNYALGLTNVRFVDYLVASVGMIPATILYVYYGKLAGDVAVAASGAAQERGIGYYAVLVLGLLATIAVTTIVTRTARRALAEEVGEVPADAGAPR
jgi:uncharacterized membrane protein YdjX (TVP38/TMEM64 family)